MLVVVAVVGTEGQQPAWWPVAELSIAHRKRERPGCWAPLCPSQPRPPLSPAPLLLSRPGPMINDGKGCNQIVVPLAPSHD